LFFVGRASQNSADACFALVRTMKRPSPGRTVTVASAGERFEAFVPAPLPPQPPIEWSATLRRRYDEAHVALGRLDAASDLLPQADLVLYSFVRKEAVLSSQIEGTQSSLADLLLFEAEEQPGVPLDDAREVSRCVAALTHGVERLRGGFPLSLRLLREMHAVLLDHPRGAGKAPGEFRRSQVWIGGTRRGNAVFVPPPADRVPEGLDRLERFLHDDPEPTTPLVKAALAHVQFETIHPFLDGNGRLGRLLIVLQLIDAGLLRQPMLYPSLFFREHRALYYRQLSAVRETGDWERWLDFFAEAITHAAADATRLAKALHELVAADRLRVAALGRLAPSALRLHDALQRTPVATAAALGRATGLVPATVNKALAALASADLVAEISERRRGRIFSYRAYADLLDAGAGGGTPRPPSTLPRT
jgi:Fic family protein